MDYLKSMSYISMATVPVFVLDVLCWRELSKFYRTTKYPFHVKPHFNVADTVTNHHQPV